VASPIPADLDMEWRHLLVAEISIHFSWKTRPGLEGPWAMATLGAQGL